MNQPLIPIFLFILFMSVFLFLYTARNKRLKWLVGITFALIAVVFLLYPFIPKAAERPFRQPYENIASISIWRTHVVSGGSNRTESECLRELPVEEGIELLDKLKSQEIDCAWFSTIMETYGIFVEIAYQDGEIERINERNCCWKEPDGLWQYRGYYFVDWRLFQRTLEQYS